MVARVKTLVWVAILVVVALTATILSNTFRHGPAPRLAARVHTEAVDEASVAEHLSAAIKFRTISHQDRKDDNRLAFSAFRAFLAATYPRVHATMGHELV